MVSQIFHSIHIWDNMVVYPNSDPEQRLDFEAEKLETGLREDDRKVLSEINATPLFTPMSCLSCMTGNTIAVWRMKHSNFFAEVGSRVSILPPALPTSTMHNRSEPIPSQSRLEFLYSTGSLKSSEASEGLTDVRRALNSMAVCSRAGEYTRKMESGIPRKTGVGSMFYREPGKHRRADLEGISGVTSSPLSTVYLNAIKEHCHSLNVCRVHVSSRIEQIQVSWLAYRRLEAG